MTEAEDTEALVGLYAAIWVASGWAAWLYIGLYVWPGPSFASASYWFLLFDATVAGPLTWLVAFTH